MKKGIFNTIFVLLLAITVHAQTPGAEFSGSVLSGCAPLSVAFKDLSTGNPKYWDWDFGNGQLSNLQNPTATFSQPGTYTVKLVVRNANGVNGITKDAYITVFPSPVVSFSADITTACLPAAINFTGSATTTAGTISGWEWNFGDGETSTAQNPQHSYTQGGYYNVLLTATSSNGCVGRRGASRYIRVVAGIVADFSSKPAVECKAPFNVAFANESSGPGTLTYNWDFGNGNTSTDKNPAAVYTSSGNYTVKLTTKSSYGCEATVDSIIPVTTYATTFNIPDSACVNQQINFQNTSAPGAALTWDFGDGTQSSEFSPVKLYAALNNYTVKLVNRFATCTDSLSKVIRIIKPAVNFTATNNTGCEAPLTVSFQNTTLNTTAWKWDFGDGQTSDQQNPSHEYTKVGKYNVKLTVTTATGCEATITKPGFVSITPPLITISNLPSGGCLPLNAAPSATASSPDGIASFSWDFGDGSPVVAGAAPPAHTYTTAGTYTLILTVTTNSGCVQPVLRSIKVGTAPSGVDFTVNAYGPCVSDSVNFTSLATGANEWLWIFGDGDSSTVEFPHHIYQDTGKLTVTLIASNNGCSTMAVTKPDFIIKKPPVAKFGTAVDCSNRLNVTFTDSSLVNKSATHSYSYLWDFGDGSTYTGENPGLHPYSQAGQYNVKLTVTNDSCTSVIIKKIFLQNLNGGFTASKTALCVNEKLTLTALEDSINIASYFWTVGNSSFGRGQSLDTLFTVPDTYQISLLVTDKYNCTDTSSQMIIVAKPVASFAPGSPGICGNSTVTFTDQSVSAAGITEWQWDFGDGNTQNFTAPPFTHQYSDTGSFEVRLRVKDAAGCMAEYTYTSPLMVTSPKASFGTETTKFCPGATLLLKDSSQGKSLKYVWDLGNGTTSTEQNPTAMYTAGTYTIKLVVRDTSGCADSLTRTDYIDVKGPVAAFDIEDTVSICGLLETKFFAKAQDYESFYWDFGDSTQSTLDNPKHFYDTYGNYTVKLFVTGYGGCIDSASHQVNVYNPNTATKIDYTVPPFSCNEQAVEFTIETPPGTTFQFFYGDGSIDSSGQTTLQHTYTYPNKYRPYVFLKDATDCQVNVSGSKVIDIRGAVPVFNIDNRNFCDSGTIFLTNYTISNDPIVSILWDFGDSQTSPDKDPGSHSYPQPGLYPVSLTVTTQSNCTKTFTDTVRVFRTPHPVITTDDITCINRALLIKGSLIQADTAIQWNWSFGDGRSSTDMNNTITYDKTGSYLIKLTATNSFGCKDTTSKSLNVAPLPVITTPGTIIIPVGGEIVLPVTYSSGITNYTWAPPSGLSCTNCPTPLAKPTFTTTYNVSVTDSNTCAANLDVTVTVLCTNENYFVPNTFSPNGDGMNDVFYPRGGGLASVQSMRVYNRWGQIVFSRQNFKANDPSKGWNGYVGNEAGLPDVYIYVIEFVCENAQIVTMKGNVTLIR